MTPSFDGSTFHVLANGVEVITMPAAGVPTGNVAFKVKNSTATFAEITVQ